MPYKLNGEVLPILPTRARWLLPKSVGDATSGLPLYPDVADFEMIFNTTPDTNLTFLYEQFAYCQASGTITCELPRLYDPTFPAFVPDVSTTVFSEYSGTTLELFSTDDRFESYVLNVRVVVRNVRFR